MKSEDSARVPAKNILLRAIDCVRNRSIPYRLMPFALPILYHIKTIAFNLNSRPCQPDGRKSLYAVPVNAKCKDLVRKVLARFGHTHFDFLLFVWDGSRFDEPEFEDCRVIYEAGNKWAFMQKYLTPELVSNYEFVFAWDDDIDILDFSASHFLEIMRRNHLEMAQPALTHDSYAWHKITLRQSDSIGKYTDFVEIMAQVFTSSAWLKFRAILEPEWNPWAYGCDEIAKSRCGFTNIGIIDCEKVRHTQPLSTEKERGVARKRYMEENQSAQVSRRISYAKLC